MNTKHNTNANHRNGSLTPTAAWTLWHQLIKLSDDLWDAFEEEFLEFCIQASEKNDCNIPLPFE